MSKFSTGLRTGMLSGDSLKSQLDYGTLRMLAGVAPATADAPQTGTLLAELRADGDGLRFDPAVDGVISKAASQIWMAASADATGTPTYFRFVANNDDGSESATAARVQGTVGLAGTDLVLTDPSITAGLPWTLNYFSIALPTD